MYDFNNMNKFITKIQLYKGVPLDNRYDHTFYFDDREQQNEYFNHSEYLFASLTEYSYVRKQKDTIMIEGKADTYEEINYIRFNNNKRWIYAFVTDVSYISETVTQIVFEVDVIQTYLLDCQLKRSFIKRCHEIDNLYSNLQPENLNIGEYTYKQIDPYNAPRDDVSREQLSDNFKTLKYIVESTFDKQLNDSIGGLYNNVYSGLEINTFNTVEEINDFLEKVAEKGKSNGIVNVTMCPSGFSVVKDFKFSSLRYFPNRPQTIDGYYPKNKKLLTYPYTCLSVSNNQGGELELQYEYWGDATYTGSDSYPDYTTLELDYQMLSNPTILIHPKNYKNLVDNFDNTITLSGYPTCAYNIDTYKQWLANNRVSLAVDGLKTVGTVAMQVASKDITGAVSTTFNATTDALKEISQQKINPIQTRGTQGDGVLVSSGALKFTVSQKSITSEYARKIDDFFSYYGYAVNRFAVPTYNIRPHWNFIQVEGLNMIANINQKYSEKIRDVFKKGITFWKKPDEIFNYNLDNAYKI